MLEGSNVEKWGGDQKTNFVINNAIETLFHLMRIITTYWYCMYLGGIPVWEKSGTAFKRVNFPWSEKLIYMGTFQNLLKCYLSFGGSLESSNAKKGNVTERRGSIVKCGKMLLRGSGLWKFCGILHVWVSYGNYWIHLHEDPMETAEYICMNVGISLVGSCHRTANVHSLYI